VSQPKLAVRSDPRDLVILTTTGFVGLANLVPARSGFVLRIPYRTGQILNFKTCPAGNAALNRRSVRSVVVLLGQEPFELRTQFVRGR